MLCRSFLVIFAIVLFVLLQFTTSDYPFGICKLFLQHLLINYSVLEVVVSDPLQGKIYYSSYVKGSCNHGNSSDLLRYSDSDYPFGIFKLFLFILLPPFDLLNLVCFNCSCHGFCCAK